MALETIVTEERLTRIEDKLDKMSEAITLLARMEERMITLFKRMDKYDETIAMILPRIDTIEESILKTTVVSSLLTRLFWIVVGAAVAAGLELFT